MLASLTKTGTSISLVVLSSKYKTFTLAFLFPKVDKSTFSNNDNDIFTGSFVLSILSKISLSLRLSPIIIDTGFLSINVGKNVELSVPFSGETIFNFFKLGSIYPTPSTPCRLPKLKSLCEFILDSKYDVELCCPALFPILLTCFGFKNPGITLSLSV